jgi:hypothetical protein
VGEQVTVAPWAGPQLWAGPQTWTGLTPEPVDILATPHYQLGDWWGNVRDTYGVEWVVESEAGWSGGAPPRNDLEDRAGEHGAHDAATLYGPRVIDLAGTALAPDRLTMLDAKDRLAAVLDPRVLGVLEVTEAHLVRHAHVRHASEPKAADVNSRSFRWSLQLVAPDPLRYARAGTTVATLEPDLPGGLIPPITPPVMLAQVSAGGLASVTNAGNHDSLPLLTITGPVTDPTVENITTGERARLQLTVAAGDTLELDSRNRSVLLNGTANRRGALLAGSAFPRIIPGVNAIRFSGSAGAGGSKLTVTHRSAWR